MLLAQIFIILATARLAGWLFARLRQPRVVGEMFAGILLGLTPQLSALFPKNSLEPLGALSQLGLVLFLFLVGLRLDLSHLREQGRVAIVASNGSIVLPFLMGSALGVFLYPRVDHGTAAPLTFALFIGAAMSITAFPVLARILREHGMERTPLGALAIACAAVDDVTAWLMLSGILTYARAGAGRPLGVSFALLAVYLAATWFAVRPLAARWKKLEPGAVLARALLLMLASAYITDWIGVHALFGAFAAGVVMPKSPAFAESLTQRIEPLTVHLLLPLFFALTGLRTVVGSFSGAETWAICALVILVAVAGKWGGGMLAARWMGMPWKESCALGVLMNTRGLVELVILNIGLDLHILSKQLFSIMVAMALVTTVMTSPLLEWMGFRQQPR